MHKCKPRASFCTCSTLALEPSDDCEVHGLAPIRRCYCGKFVRSVRKEQNLLQKGRVPASANPHQNRKDGIKG